ncbi:(2Fe-2S)-binding protein [Pseudooceanicola sediminis]|uniref:(2Fe-2S)-binding protein n=1 Tax=Pseudooceanicola sediminis TaxID=2211117 RepID=A0A399IWU8_9RHOB|nr:(2Fe-2S)-binding protein [Pseudooceanicola sediminis]KAA2312411.1 (2Fe-2S)-binding protein [Puniceibacterium sp. HSS470]RII37460.1 (2Fe-2S)-binding protein [Pseudooceanicola sediminis]|tara:strand:- start:4736 stop:5242 length:507 start_codon:yes stop_codon:yes gene_type:complete
MSLISKDGALRVAFTLNGRETTVETVTSRVLSDLLRDDMNLKGTRVSCGRTVCGACSVLVDGFPRAACSTFAFEVEGRDVQTIEGVEAPDGTLDPVQAAFAAKSAFQCGFCTSGMILLAKSLLATHPDPDRATIIAWISSNICRCTGYELIVEAVQDAARAMREGPKS